jgi:hypothetical protein
MASLGPVEEQKATRNTMTSYRKTSDHYSFTATHSRTVEEYSEHEPERDPTPSLPPLRVVTCDAEVVSESSRPLAKCRQITPIRFPRKKVVG